MPDVIRRYGLDKWGPLTAALFLIVAVVVVALAVIVIVTRPSVAQVIAAGQALATAAVALGAAVAGHGFLRGHREAADATREAAAITAQAASSATPVTVTNVIAGDKAVPSIGANIASGGAHDATVAGEDPAAMPGTPVAVPDDVEAQQTPRLESATTPDVVAEHHGPEDLDAAGPA